jgi:hypothetical protein
LYKTVTRHTRIAKDGVLYDIRKTDDKPAVTSQRKLQGTQQIPFSGISTAPPADSPDFKQLGNDIIAGQPCVRFVSTSRTPGAATTTLCVFLSPRSCPRSHYLQQLEQKTVAPDGTVVVLGRTSELLIGKIGEVLPKNSIVAP